MTTPTIALLPLKLGTKEYLPGDRFERTMPHVRQHIDDRTFDIFERNHRVGELTRTSYAMAIGRRREGQPTIGDGFTEAFLLEAGIIDAPAAPVAKKREVKEKTTTPSGPPFALEGTPYFLIPFKPTKAPATYDLVDNDRNLLREARFKSVAKAKEFADDLLAQKAKASGDQHGDHVQSESRGPDQPG